MFRSLLNSRWTLPLLIVLCILAAMGNLATNEFSSWDDQYNIWQNPRLNPPTIASLADYWKAPALGLYIPLTYTVWGILACTARLSTPDAQGITLNPWVFHSANLAFHMLSALVVFGIIRRLYCDRAAACVGALVFALHPVQVEPVAWAAGLKDVLCGMLTLLAVWQYLIFAQEPALRWRYALATIAFVLAMLAKPTALVAPLIVFAMDRWLLGRPIRKIMPVLLPWAALSLVCAIVGRIAQPAIGVAPAPLWARPLIACDALAFYLYKLLWPAELAIDYGHRPAAVMGRWWFYLTWIIPLGLAAVLTAKRRRYAELFVATVVFAAGVMPVLGFVTFLFQQFSTTADHYLYISMLGPALAAAWAVKRFNRTIALGLASVVLILFGARSFDQGRYWYDDVELFSHTLRINPRSFMAMNNLGRTYQLRGDPDRAEPLLKKAIELWNDYPEPHLNLAELYQTRGQLGKTVYHLKRAAEIMLLRPPQIRPDLVPLLNDLAGNLIELGRYDEAGQYIQIALKMRPQNPNTLKSLQLLKQRQAGAATHSQAD